MAQSLGKGEEAAAGRMLDPEAVLAKLEERGCFEEEKGPGLAENRDKTGDRRRQGWFSHSCDPPRPGAAPRM